MRVLCYDRKSGNIYHAFCSIPDKGVIILTNPVCRRTASVDIKSFKEGCDVITYEYMYYREVCRDIMVSIENVFVEIIQEHEKIEWIDRTEENVEKLLEAKKQELEKKSAEDKQNYYKDKSPLYIFFKKFFS